MNSVEDSAKMLGNSSADYRRIFGERGRNVVTNASTDNLWIVLG